MTRDNPHVQPLTLKKSNRYRVDAKGGFHALIYVVSLAGRPCFSVSSISDYSTPWHIPMSFDLEATLVNSFSMADNLR